MRSENSAYRVLTPTAPGANTTVPMQASARRRLSRSRMNSNLNQELLSDTEGKQVAPITRMDNSESTAPVDSECSAFCRAATRR